MKIGVYVAGRNCAIYAISCIESLLCQTFSDWVAYIVDDASLDGTRHACKKAIGDDPRIAIETTPARHHSCWNKLTAIRGMRYLLEPDDILVGLDLDDRLHPHALQTIHDAHAGGAWVTYGNWIDQHSNIGTEFRRMTPEIFAQIRELPWFMTAPNSFRVKLFDAMPPAQFQWKGSGRYYETGFDGSVMYAAADLAGADRIVGIASPIYVYNRERSDNVLQAWPKEHRQRLFAEQRAKPRLQRMDP